MKYKSKPRLKDLDYRGLNRYFVTICTSEKEPLFVDVRLVETILSIIREKALKHAFTVWGYCFMPDHLHLLLEGTDASSDLKIFVKAFKQRSGYLFGMGTADPGKKLWQPGYYDHVLRRDEDTAGVLRYILENPVRKGLADNFTDYRYSGSFVIDIEGITF
jgi:putative transposase